MSDDNEKLQAAIRATQEIQRISANISAMTAQAMKHGAGSTAPKVKPLAFVNGFLGFVIG